MPRPTESCGGHRDDQHPAARTSAGLQKSGGGGGPGPRITHSRLPGELDLGAFGDPSKDSERLAGNLHRAHCRMQGNQAR